MTNHLARVAAGFISLLATRTVAQTQQDWPGLGNSGIQIGGLPGRVEFSYEPQPVVSPG